MQHPWMAPPAHIPRSTGPDPAAGTFYMQARLARGSIHVHRRCKDQAWYLGSPVLTPRQVHSKFDCFPERARAHGPWIETFQGYTGHTGRSQHGKWILRRSGLSHAECCLKPETPFPVYPTNPCSRKILAACRCSARILTARRAPFTRVVAQHDSLFAHSTSEARL